MSTDRFDLLPGPDGQEQWAMIDRRPTRGQIKEASRRNRQAVNAGTPLEGQDWVVALLCPEWTVYGADGKQLPSPPRTGKAMDDLPADVLQPLIVELNGVINAVDRGGALLDVTSTLRSLAWSLDEAGTSRLEELVSGLQELFGVTPPNASDQAAP